VYSQDFQSTSWGYRSKDGDVNVSIRPRLAANNGEALLQAAAQGLGITRPPDFMAQPYLDNGSVVAVLPRFEPTPLGIYAVLPSNRYIPHRVSVLIDFLASVLTNDGLH
jgi:DNA-binding transcriptional LysR family regulator